MEDDSALISRLLRFRDGFLLNFVFHRDIELIS
jgi:hypothetical protein